MYVPRPLTSDTVEGVARITEARLKREVSEGKIIDFQRSEVGFDVIRAEAMNSKQNKVMIDRTFSKQTVPLFKI